MPNDAPRRFICRRRSWHALCLLPERLRVSRMQMQRIRLFHRRPGSEAPLMHVR